MKVRFLLPLGIFAVMAILFGYVLTEMNKGEYNPRDLPSALIDKPAPEFSLPDLFAMDQVITRDDLLGQVTLVNVFASGAWPVVRSTRCSWICPERSWCP